MVLHRKRSLFGGLGLTVALVLAVALPATASAVSTLTGENFSGGSPSGNSASCSVPRTFSVSGTATGPYAGTFTETGSFASGDTFSATFTISSGTTTITGTKSGGSGSSQCGSIKGIGFGIVDLTQLSYTATIHTPNGNFHDQGTSAVNVSIIGSVATLTETFTSSLTEAVPVAPTSKDQCKNNGWKAFPQFKNQGQCVSSFQPQPQT